MSDLIDKGVLYNQFANLEAIALEQVEKHLHDEDKTEWRKWSVILTERTAYKYDVFDAPTVDAEPVKHGHWVIEPDETVMHCDVCGWAFEYYGGLEEENNYCPFCGAKMDGKESEE